VPTDRRTSSRPRCRDDPRPIVARSCRPVLGPRADTGGYGRCCGRRPAGRKAQTLRLLVRGTRSSASRPRHPGLADLRCTSATPVRPGQQLGRRLQPCRPHRSRTRRQRILEAPCGRARVSNAPPMCPARAMRRTVVPAPGWSRTSTAIDTGVGADPSPSRASENRGRTTRQAVPCTAGSRLPRASSNRIAAPDEPTALVRPARAHAAGRGRRVRWWW
jgi:hypothetical protein